MSALIPIVQRGGIPALSFDFGRILPIGTPDDSGNFGRLLEYFVATSREDCWLWSGGTNRDGYGCFGLRVEGGKFLTSRSHRLTYRFLVGPIPAGTELDHVCRTRLCVNPFHLEAVSHTVNVRRGNGGANMRAKTHCPKGHPYSGDNLKIICGRRCCAACRKARGLSIRQLLTKAGHRPRAAKAALPAA